MPPLSHGHHPTHHSSSSSRKGDVHVHKAVVLRCIDNAVLLRCQHALLRLPSFRHPTRAPVLTLESKRDKSHLVPLTNHFERPCPSMGRSCLAIAVHGGESPSRFRQNVGIKAIKARSSPPPGLPKHKRKNNSISQSYLLYAIQSHVARLAMISKRQSLNSS